MSAIPGFDRWLERPYTDAIEAQMDKDAAVEEFWDEEAAAWAEREPDHIHEAIANTDLLARAARFAYAKPSDEVLRALGSDLLRSVRAACEVHEAEINAECIKRAEAYRREARDMMRGGE